MLTKKGNQMAKWAKSSEINDIVKVSKMGVPLHSVGCNGTNGQPTPSVARSCKEVSSIGTTDTTTDPSNINTRDVCNGEKRELRGEEKEVDITIRLSSLNAMSRLKSIEDKWKFQEQLQRRFVPTYESCPKGGHCHNSNIDVDRYCNFLEFPSTSIERRTIGALKPKRIERECREANLALSVNGKIGCQGQDEVKIERSSKDVSRNSSRNIGKTKQIANSPSKSQYTTKDSVGKLTKNKINPQKVGEGDRKSLDGEQKFEYVPYFVTILEKDGSIRYVEDDGITSESEESDKDSILVVTSKVKRVDTPKKVLTSKKKAKSTTVSTKKCSSNVVKKIKRKVKHP